MKRIKLHSQFSRWPVEPFRRSGNLVAVHCGGDETSAYSSFAVGYTRDEMRDLLRELSGKSSENEDLREKINELKQRIDKHEELLQELFDPSRLPELGEFEKWRESLPLTSEYRGKHVVFIADKGVIASADSLDELMKIALKKSKPDELTVGFVPLASVLF